MPIILDPTKINKLRRRPKRIQAIRTRKAELTFRRRLEALWDRVLFPISDQIKELAKQKPVPLTAINQLIEQGLETARVEYGINSDAIITEWRLSLDYHHRIEFERALQKSVGVDISVVLNQEHIKKAMEGAAMENVTLIRTIPEKYFGEIHKAVLDNYYGRPLPENRSLLKQIQEIRKVSYKRARLISRDQTTKLTGTLNQVRQEAIGVQEYIWHTVRDERVVGKPGGVYPPKPGLEKSTAHGNHYERQGKKFRWDTPPPDGHPGQAIQCRCWAEPIIDTDRLVERALGKK